MKTLITIVGLIIICLSSHAQSKNFKRYANKSGRIEYKWTGKTTGTEVLTWNNWGAQEKKVSNTKTTILGITEVSNTITIMLEATVYEWKQGAKEGIKHTSEIFNDLSEDVKDWDSFGQRSLKKLGYNKQGTTNIMGKTCDLWVGMLGSIAVYKSYPLQTNTNVLGIKSQQVATKMTIDIKHVAEEFKIPTDIEFNVAEIPNTSIDYDNTSEADNQTEKKQKNNKNTQEEEIIKAKKALKNLFNSF